MDKLIERIISFIERSNTDVSDDEFNELAIALFSRQYLLIEPYRRYCDALNATPKQVKSWNQIPVVPVAAFKQFDISCAPLTSVNTVYYSSGTSGTAASKHYMDQAAVQIYYTSLRRGFYYTFNRFKQYPLWAIMQSPIEAPNSSLSAMLGALNAERYYWDDNSRFYNDLSNQDEPIIIFGTAFAFVGLFDFMLGQPKLNLPAGSVIIETGGFKGRSREVSREELYSMFVNYLNVSQDHCYSEYGMSEMASQFYSRGLNPVKYGMHWVRTRIIDPITGTDSKPGDRGLLAHIDLANYNSIMALQTEDAGRFFDNGFILLGRAENAEIRGCSLTAEELWERQANKS